MPKVRHFLKFKVCSCIGTVDSIWGEWGWRTTGTQRCRSCEEGLERSLHKLTLQERQVSFKETELIYSEQTFPQNRFYNRLKEIRHVGDINIRVLYERGNSSFQLAGTSIFKGKRQNCFPQAKETQIKSSNKTKKKGKRTKEVEPVVLQVGVTLYLSCTNAKVTVHTTAVMKKDCWANIIGGGRLKWKTNYANKAIVCCLLM